MKRLILICGVCVLFGLMLGRVLNSGKTSWSVAADAYAVQPSASAAEGLARQRAERPALPAGMTAEEQTNISIYEHANPSVVNINTRTIEVDNFWMMRHEAKGSGSGVILDKQGHVLTNYHVVEGAQTIEVTLASSQIFSATLVGKDKEHDIAVLRVEAPPKVLLPISFGRSDDLRVGQRVYVLGNPFGWDGTLTTGIISSLNRDLPSRTPGRVMRALIQTDAAMNPGNSGGPLLNSRSEMIGMCVAIATQTGRNAGVGFAIPVDRIKQIVPELIENGRVVRADIGITHVMETNGGLIVASLTPDGPAAQAGLQGFRKIVQRRQQGPVVYETETIDRSYADRIVAVDDERMRTGVQFRDKIWQYRPGKVIELTVIRDGKEKQIAITLGAN